MVRPPYGEVTPSTLIALVRRKLQIVLWTQYTKDFEARNGEQLRVWFELNAPVSGSIVLLHDNMAITAENGGTQNRHSY